MNEVDLDFLVWTFCVDIRSWLDCRPSDDALGLSMLCFADDTS